MSSADEILPRLLRGKPSPNIGCHSSCRQTEIGFSDMLADKKDHCSGRLVLGLGLGIEGQVLTFVRHCHSLALKFQGAMDRSLSTWNQMRSF